MDVEATSLPTFDSDLGGIPSAATNSESESEETGELGPALPNVYLLSVPHPKNRKLLFSEIISLSHPKEASDIAEVEARRLENTLDAGRPWAPWNSLADFGYTESAVKGVLSKDIIDMQLKGLSGPWSNPGGSRITMKDYRDYKLYLAKARTLGVKFLNATVEADLWGESKKYTFYYRDPWEWILSLVTDPGLARVSQWQSRRLYYCENGQMERYVHEPFTADRWHEVDSELPAANPLMHCWLPLHIWLDKGLVTSHVKMFRVKSTSKSWKSFSKRSGKSHGLGNLSVAVMMWFATFIRGSSLSPWISRRRGASPVAELTERNTLAPAVSFLTRCSTAFISSFRCAALKRCGMWLKEPGVLPQQLNEISS
ncbi:hypothetical protein R3P38DRAFT_2623823 [Favolaschia claudopus]|uniref:Uncharacterized protein n=1 Tax=Favolaschia claudopus TaxID=2862362 RepID=A0AAW0BKS8_9AGAR